jgi:hypothetical protein
VVRTWSERDADLRKRAIDLTMTKSCVDEVFRKWHLLCVRVNNVPDTRN